MRPSGHDYSDLPGYADAAAEARQEREYRRAQRMGDDYVPRRWARPTPPLPAEVTESEQPEVCN